MASCGVQAVVLTAGAGTRLRPLTLTRSKALAPLCGRPMLQWVLGSLLEAGVEDFVLVVADLDDDVARWSRGWLGARRLTLRVQAARLGMAHALSAAAPAIGGRFVMTACDTIIEGATFAAQFARHAAVGAGCTLFLEPVESPEHIRRTAIVSRDGDRVVGIVEKPEPEDAPSEISAIPIYLFEPGVLDYLPEVRPSARGEYEIQDAIKLVIARDANCYGWLVPNRWQISTCDELLALNREWLRRGHQRCVAGVDCRPPVHLGERVVCGPGCVVGPEAVVEDGATLGAGAVVRRSLVLAGAQVPPGAVVEDAVVGAGD